MTTSTPHLDTMMQLSEDRAENYLHIAKRLVLNHFGPATEHMHTDMSIALATAMMQYEGSQMIADAVRVAD